MAVHASFTVSTRSGTTLGEILDRYRARAEQAMEAALYEEAEKIMTASKAIVPFDVGTLHSTGHVELPRREGDRIVVDLGYGGPAAPYALVQHEDLTLRHAEGRTAKYLERPFNEAQDGMSERIAEQIRRRLASG